MAQGSNNSKMKLTLKSSKVGTIYPIESDNPLKELDQYDPNYGQMLARPDPDIINKKVEMRELLKKKTQQQSTPGIYVNAFEITQSDWDNQTDWQVLMQDYTLMRNGDSFVSTSIDILLNPIMNAEVMIYPGVIDEESKPSDKANEAHKYIEWTFDNLYNGLDNFIRHLVLAYYFGFAMFEYVWLKGEKYPETGKLTNQLKKLSPIQQDTLRRVYYDMTGENVGVQLYKRLPNWGQRLLDMASEQYAIFTPFEEFGNILGRSLLRPIRMVWDHKQKIWRGSARAASRGAGIPVATLAKNIKSTDDVLGMKVNQIVQTMGNAENTGLIEQTDVLTYRLMGLENQQHNIELLNLANSEIVYNTLSQFIIAGIGQSGSRSATESHKAPYLEALDVYFKQCENFINQIIKIVMDNSYLYGMDEKEYPYVIFERNKEVDLGKMASNIQSLVSSGGLTLTMEDQKYIRSAFGLPELTEEEIQQAKDEKSANNPFMNGGQNNDKNNIQNNGNNTNDKTTGKQQIDNFGKDKFQSQNKDSQVIPASPQYADKSPKILEKHNGFTSVKMQKFNPNPVKVQPQFMSKNGKSKTFHPDMMKKTIEHLDKATNKITRTVNDHYGQMMDSVKHQLKKDRTKAVKIPDSIKESLKKELADHYNNSYMKGFDHSKAEISKINPGKNMLEKAGHMILLASMRGAINLSNNHKKLEYTIDSLSSAIENGVNKNMVSVNDTNIYNAGGIDDYIDSTFGNGQKGLQASLVNNTTSGYFEGTGDAQDDYESQTGEKLLKTYTTQAEWRNRPENVCEICYPYEGMVFTQDESESLGLNWSGTPLNPECLGLMGGNDCQCKWVVEGIE